MKQPLNNKKGVAFLITIVLLGLVVIASAALSLMLLRDAFTIKRLKASSQAYYLAEAGIEEAIEKLWSSSFSTSGFPISRSLGAGTISVSLDASQWSSDNILLISSAGAVSGISRTIKTEVKANVIPSFDYAVLSNGKILVTMGSHVYCNSSIGIHSNSTASGGFFATSAVDVVGFFIDSYVYGNASAVGKVRERLKGHITGTKTNNAPAVSLPSFDVDFWNYYYNLANAGGDVYTPGGGMQIFNSNLAPANGVIYVNGNVSLEGTFTITGCIVATGDIYVNLLSNGVITQNQVGNFPALMSRGGDISIWDPTTLNGFVYAADDITIFSLLGTPGDITINGSLMGGSDVSIMDYSDVNYVKQNPPGLGANPIGWILNWNEQ